MFYLLIISTLVLWILLLFLIWKGYKQRFSENGILKWLLGVNGITLILTGTTLYLLWGGLLISVWIHEMLEPPIPNENAFWVNLIQWGGPILLFLMLVFEGFLVFRLGKVVKSQAFGPHEGL